VLNFVCNSGGFGNRLRLRRCCLGKYRNGFDSGLRFGDWLGGYGRGFQNRFFGYWLRRRLDEYGNGFDSGLRFGDWFWGYGRGFQNWFFGYWLRRRMDEYGNGFDCGLRFGDWLGGYGRGFQNRLFGSWLWRSYLCRCCSRFYGGQIRGYWLGENFDDGRRFQGVRFLGNWLGSHFGHLGSFKDRFRNGH
jgi:hypothetical protein